jgi:hypothetical protein
LGAGLLVASGIYLAAYWLPHLLRPRTAPGGLVSFSEHVSGAASGLVANHQLAVVILAALLLASSLAAILRGRHVVRRDGRPELEPSVPHVEKKEVGGWE